MKTCSNHLYTNLENFILVIKKHLYPISICPVFIVLTWGKYEYQKLHMGVCNIPNIFQGKISKLFKGFNVVCVYIDDVLVIAKHEFKDHLNALERVIQLITEAALKEVKKSNSLGKQKLNILVYG